MKLKQSKQGKRKRRPDLSTLILDTARTLNLREEQALETDRLVKQVRGEEFKEQWYPVLVCLYEASGLFPRDKQISWSLPEFRTGASYMIKVRIPYTDLNGPYGGLGGEAVSCYADRMYLGWESALEGRPCAAYAGSSYSDNQLLLGSARTPEELVPLVVDVLAESLRRFLKSGPEQQP